MKTYIWTAENGKFRGAKTRHETTAGFRDFDKIAFRATTTDDRDIFTVSPIPAAYPTIQTHATTATKILNGATVADAKPKRATTGDGAKTATGRFSIAIENDLLVMRDDRDATATAKIDRDGVLTLTVKPATATGVQSTTPSTLLARAHTIAVDFVAVKRDDAINPYIAKTATATAGKYSADVSPTATTADAISILSRVIATDENRDADAFSLLGDVKIITTGARDFIDWRDAQTATA